MSFTLQTTDMDLGDTPIENIFINDYMPMANGTYVKVYLLGYKYAHDRDEKIDVNNQTIAKHLEIPLEDVLGAWDFWEKKGIIIKEIGDSEDKYNYQVKFLNLKQLYIKNNLNLFERKEEEKVKKIKDDSKRLIDANQIPQVNNMFNQIDFMLRRQTVPLEKQKILSWIEDYNMNPDVIEKAVSYGAENKGQRNLNYIEGIIRNWYSSGLTNMEAVMEHFKEEDERYYRYQKVMKTLGLDKRAAAITKDEMKTIDHWFEGYEFSMEMVMKACENSVNIASPNIGYIDAILRAWNKKGIKQVEDIETKDKREVKGDYKKRTYSPKKGQALKTRFHNFEQRTDQYSAEDIEDVVRKKREAYNKKRAKGES